MWNTKQLATVGETKEVMAFLDKFNIGGGVDNGVEDEPVFIPQYSHFPTPELGERRFWHVRLRNGEVHNVGLILFRLSQYAPEWVAREMK